jgi:hypothetical protein
MSYLDRQQKQSHTHEQSTPAIEWVINHDLDRYPIVNVYSVVNGVEIMVNPTEVQVLNMNSCKLVFGTPISGFAEIF